jgi:hypothetical protein
MIPLLVAPRWDHCQDVYEGQKSPDLSPNAWQSWLKKSFGIAGVFWKQGLNQADALQGGTCPKHPNQLSLNGNLKRRKNPFNTESHKL